MGSTRQTANIALARLFGVLFKLFLFHAHLSAFIFWVFFMEINTTCVTNRLVWVLDHKPGTRLLHTETERRLRKIPTILAAQGLTLAFTPISQQLQQTQYLFCVLSFLVLF